MTVKKTTLFLMAFFSIASLFFGAKYIFGQEVRTDCNIPLQQSWIDGGKDDFGFFNKEDIKLAYSNMLSNCPPRMADPNTIQSQYLFDHLLWIGIKKLNGEVETLGLKNDPQGKAFKDILEKLIEEAKTNKVTSIPSQLADQYKQLWLYDGNYDKVAAREQGVYKGAEGLYTKYMALCDLARGLYFNNQIVGVSPGTKTIDVNAKYNNCATQIQEEIERKNLEQDGAQAVSSENVSQKVQESMNSYSHEELSKLLETTQQAKDKMVDVSKKIDQKMENCNPTDT